MQNSHHQLGQSGQFNDSFVMQPINLNSHSNRLHSHKNSQNNYLLTNNFGQYEPYKLNNYIGTNQQSINSLTKPKLISIVSLDPQSLVLSENAEFQQLLKRYSVYDVVFIAVNGKKQVGKSFFCDKILNLAEVKGNHFCRNNSPALNVWETPFFKGDLCIFLVEVSGCEFSSKAYDILTTISLLLASSVVFVNGNEEKDKIQDFNNKVNELLHKVSFRSQEASERRKFLPKTLFNLVRKKPQQMDLDELEPKKSQYFIDIHSKALPNAMTPSYKGDKSDLSSFSFLSKQCINESYIKEVSKIFKHIIDHLHEKNYNDLYINGNIVHKLLSSLVTQMNARKTIRIELIYQQIIRDLYISAYNYCVISYQKELQDYFGDEKAKNMQEMFQTFEISSNNTLERFNEFNLSKELFAEYENKLIKHMNQKELLILEINKQKTYEELNGHFRNIGGKDIMKVLKEDQEQLNHGRQFYLNDKIQQLSKSSNNVDMKLLSALQERQKKISEKKNELARLQSKKNQIQKLQNQKLQGIKKTERELDRDLNKMKQDISILQKRRKNIKGGSGVKELQQEKLQQTEKLNRKKQMLNKLKGEDEDKVIGQLVAQNKEKISKIKEAQKKIQVELNSIKNPQAVEKGKKGSSMEKKDGKSPQKQSKNNK